MKTAAREPDPEGSESIGRVADCWRDVVLREHRFRVTARRKPRSALFTRSDEGYICRRPANRYPGTLPVIVFGDHTRRFKFIDFEFAVGADGTKLLHPITELEPRFFYHYLCTLNLESQGYSRHYRFLKETLVSVPPLAEQKRIVQRLELLLGKVSSSQQRLSRVPALLKRFRQSVLAAACSGKLTADWREENEATENAAEFVLRVQEERRNAFGLQTELAKKSGERKPKKRLNESAAQIDDSRDGSPSSWCMTRIGDVCECLDYMRIPINKTARQSRQGAIPYYGANGQVGWIDTHLFEEALVLVVEDESFIGREKPFSYVVRGKCWVNNHAHVLRPLGGMPADFLNICLAYYDFVPLTCGTTGRRKFAMLPPDVLAQEFLAHDLVDALPIVALRAIKNQGHPQRILTSRDWEVCQHKVCSAMNWCCFDTLNGPESHVMLLDDRTAKAVADSKNDAITAAELQHLPHNPCLIEFYRPIEIAENVKRGVRLRAVGFEAIGNAEFPAAVVCFYLDYWQQWSHDGKTKSPCTIKTWFGGFHMAHIDSAACSQIGIANGSAVESDILKVCLRVARNLWDFVTSRSIRYEQVQRKPPRQFNTGKGPQDLPGVQSLLDREVTLLFLSRDCKSAGDLEQEGEAESRPLPRPWDHRVEIPGTFHELVYCAKCPRLHRHDLLGQACRKCGEIVGPRTNLRVEKIWHSPYVKGPEGTPLKNVVRDVHRRKRSGGRKKE